MQAVGAYLQQYGGAVSSALDEKRRYRPGMPPEAQSLPHFGVCRLISLRFYGDFVRLCLMGAAMKQIRCWPSTYVDLMVKLGLVRFSLLLASALVVLAMVVRMAALSRCCAAK